MKLDVLATGYPSLDYILAVSHSPTIGETALLSALPDDQAVTYGGCGLNVAVGLQALGHRTGVAAVLGDDPLGQGYHAHLREKGIDTRDVTLLPGAYTSRSYLFRSPDGEYQNFFFAGAADEWNETLNLRSLSDARFALVTVGAFRYNAQFVRLARAANVPLVWQLKSDIFAFPKDSIHEFAAASAYILMNHIEADYVQQTLGVRQMGELLNDLTKAVVITEGARGCEVYSADGHIRLAAVPPAQIVDTTGAGDAFTAGFLAGVLREYELKVSAQIGATVASFVLEETGCQTNLPDWKQTQKRYERHRGSL